MSRQHGPLAAQAARRAATLPAAPLPAADRAFFEARFGADFSRVRVHAGAQAGMLAGALGAKAFASGEHIVFGDGRFAPGTTPGRELLAHELAHVVQQRNGGGGGGADAAESRARAAAPTAARGGGIEAAQVGGAEPGIQCDPDEEKQPETPPAYTPLPPVPNYQLSTPKIDWRAMRDPYQQRGAPFSMRDADSIQAEWQRSSRLLDVFGITDRFKLGFITKDWILNKGLANQVDDLNLRDNPSGFDKLNRDWDIAHPGFKTPIVSVPLYKW